MGEEPNLQPSESLLRKLTDSVQQGRSWRYSYLNFKIKSAQRNVEQRKERRYLFVLIYIRCATRSKLAGQSFYEQQYDLFIVQQLVQIYNMSNLTGISLKSNFNDDDSASEYVPEVCKTEKLKRISKKRGDESQDKVMNKNAWSLRENILYKQFLMENLPLFMKSLKEKKQIKINILVSQYVKTRDSSQCRSHHQKMLQYHGTIPSIIAHIQRLQDTLSNPTLECPGVQIRENMVPETPAVQLREVDFVWENVPSLWDALLHPAESMDA